MKDVIFRKATVEDCRALSELKRDVWSTTYSGIYPQEKLDVHLPKHATWVGVGRVLRFAQINCEAVAFYFCAFMILIGSAVQPTVC